MVFERLFFCYIFIKKWPVTVCNEPIFYVVHMRTLSFRLAFLLEELNMTYKKLFSCIALGCALLTTSACGGQNVGQVDAQAASQATANKMPNFSKAPIADEYAVFNTNYGTFKVRLYGSKVPITVKNFEHLVKQGFYKGLIFHRVIEGFMIQGGDPNGNGTGGPGYDIPDEFVKDLHFNKMGMLAMANRGPNTGGSQFFITLGPTDWLDNKHTIFGSVVQGMDVVEKIGKVKTGAQDKPVEPVIINSISLEPINDDANKTDTIKTAKK